MSRNIGLSCYPGSPEKLSKILSIMKEYGLGTIRISSRPPWMGWGSHGLDTGYIDKALAEGHRVIIDPIHLYPPNATTAADAKTHRGDIIQVFKSLGARYAGIVEAEFELVNEYQDPADYYSFMQGLVTELREAGVTNRFVVNKPPQNAPPYQVIVDPVETVQGFHPYMDYWSPSSVTAEIDRGLKVLPSLCLTEFGASTKEGYSYTSALVAEVNSVLDANKNKPVDFCLWLNEGWNPNWPSYEMYGLKLPA